MFKEFKWLLRAGLVIIVMGIIIFYGSWPYLWQDLLFGTERVFGFYKTIGTTARIDSRFEGPWGINMYPIFWIFTTTPPLILFLSILGSIYGLWRIVRKKDETALIFLLWFCR